jgi:hypothetical protein
MMGAASLTDGPFGVRRISPGARGCPVALICRCGGVVFKVAYSCQGQIFGCSSTILIELAEQTMPAPLTGRGVVIVTRHRANQGQVLHQCFGDKTIFIWDKLEYYTEIQREVRIREVVGVENARKTRRIQ